MDGKMYQVFVSSTYEDLMIERQEVMNALLELDCIPSGMELFPATNDTQWDVIKKVINDCDYYIVIIGGRYGSIGKEGASYTEMEYRYAESVNKPIISFLFHDIGKIPRDKTEQDEAKMTKLKDFIEYAKKLRVCKFWHSPEHLGSLVSRSIVQLIKTHPGVGWVRGDKLPSRDILLENSSLRKKIEELESELSSIRSIPPKGTENLSQGDDKIELEFRETSISGDRIKKIETTWNKIFKIILPLLTPEGSENEIYNALKSLVPVKFEPFSATPTTNPTENTKSMIKIQLLSLGIITESDKKRTTAVKGKYWKLTTYGLNLMKILCAIRK